MTRTVKALIGELLLFFVIGVSVMYFSAPHYPRTAPVVIREMMSEAEKVEAAKVEEAEKIHTYYINVGGHTANVCGGYTDYPSYSFNTETGEWSDGGNYVISNTSNYLCKVNKYGEVTRVGIILAIEYGDRLICNYMR